MSDVDEIRALVNSYARLLDSGDVDAVVALFGHSTWRSFPHGSMLRGSTEVRPVYEALLSRGADHRTKHLITNLTIDVTPAGTTASSHCYWTVLQDAPGEPISITRSGQYDDSFEKIGEGWRFTDRLITVDLTSES